MRPTLLLSFPRVAGGIRRVWTSSGEETEGRRATPSIGGCHLPLSKGSIVYCPAATAGTPGELCIVWADFDPESESELFSGKAEVELAELLSVPTPLQSVKGKVRMARSNTYALVNSMIRDEYGTRPASFSGVGSRPWRREAASLWTVDHLVKETAPSWKVKPEKPGEGQAAQWSRKAFSFDFKEAERQIAYAMSQAVTEPEPPEALVSEMAEELAALPALQNAGEQLKEAQASAQEAAAARNRPPPARAPQRPAELADARVRKQVCRYPGMECAGCGVPFKLGETIAPGGDGLVHANFKEGARNPCQEMAMKRLIEETKEAASKAKSKGDLKLQSDKRQAQLTHRFGADRIALAINCLDGKCKVHGEVRRMCMGARDSDGVRQPCGRGLHAMACGKISKAHAATALMVCVDCRVAEMSLVSCSSNSDLRERCCQSMLGELSTGETKTAKNVHDFEKLEKRFMADHAGASGEVLIREPRYSEESYIAFLHWLVTDAGRARTLGLIVRMSAAAMAKLELRVIPNAPRVKAIVKELATQVGTDPEPCTIPSDSVISTMLTEVLPEQCKSSEYIHARSRVMFDGEVAGGLRIGEISGGGEGHGALAGLVDIATPVGGGESTINIRLEDSKTGFGRDATYLGKTKGSLGLECEKNLRHLWKLSGFKITKTTVDGLVYETPDYCVMRVDLLGMSPKLFKFFMTAAGNATTGEIALQRSAILKYARDNYESTTLGEESRFVNIAGGAKGGKEIAEAKQWLKDLGLERFGDVVKGPLLRATAPGSPRDLTHMPIKPGSTYTQVPQSLFKAWELNVKRGVVDDQLDLDGLEKPKFGHHANRRRADKTAQDSKEKTGVTDGEIDDHFGWNQKERKKTSRLHYQGRQDRLKRARVTMML